MQREGIIGKLSNRFKEQRGLKQNQKGGAVKPAEVKTPSEAAAENLPIGTYDGSVARTSSTHGNPAATQKRAAATEVSDELVDGVLTGDMPGDTGRANTKKARRAANRANQGTLFD